MHLGRTGLLKGGSKVNPVVVVTPPANPVYPLVAVNVQGGVTSGRAAPGTSDRDALAKFAWVQWGVYRSSSLVTTLEQSIAYIKAINPTSLHSNYTIAYELGGQLGPVTSITRSGTTITITTSKYQSGTTVGQTFGLFGDTAFKGEWVVATTSGTVNGTGTITATVSGAAATAADETGIVNHVLYQMQNTANYVHVKKAFFTESWMHRKQGTTGPWVQWSTTFGALDMNLTDWCPTDANGDRWVDYYAKDTADFIFGNCTGLDMVFLDNFNDPRDDVVNDAAYPSQRGKADWKRSGTMQNRTDADILAAHAAGYVRVATTHRTRSTGRAKSPNVQIVGNVDTTFETNSGWTNTIENAFLEGFTGASYSLSLSSALTHHDAVRSRLLSPGRVWIAAQGTSVTDYKGMRYGLCAALLRPTSYFSFTSGGNYNNTTWYDEFDIDIGTPVSAEPTTTWQLGLYKMEFTKAWALVNPTTSAVTIDLSAYGLRKWGSADIGRTPQDATTNDGSAVTSLTIPAKDGIILLKV